METSGHLQPLLLAGSRHLRRPPESPGVVAQQGGEGLCSQGHPNTCVELSCGEQLGLERSSTSHNLINTRKEDKMKVHEQGRSHGPPHSLGHLKESHFSYPGGVAPSAGPLSLRAAVLPEVGWEFLARAPLRPSPTAAPSTVAPTCDQRAWALSCCWGYSCPRFRFQEWLRGSCSSESPSKYCVQRSARLRAVCRAEREDSVLVELLPGWGEGHSNNGLDWSGGACDG